MIVQARLLPLLTTIPKRLYSIKSSKSKTTKMYGRQVHKEIMRYVKPSACIRVQTDLFTKIRPADVHAYPDADAFIAEMHGGHVKNCTAKMDVIVNDDESEVVVKIAKLETNSDFHCELSIPIKATLKVESNNAVSVENLHGDEIIINALQNIHTREIRSEKIELASEKGALKCEGLLLGRNTVISTKDGGSIQLEKSQGDFLDCKTVNGNINVDCCYAESSKFETDCGQMNLKNVHKKSTIAIRKTGALNMIGFHGNLNAFVKSGSINIQLSQLCDTNQIEIEEAASRAEINISDEIAADSRIEVNARNIILKDELRELGKSLCNSNQTLTVGSADAAPSKLLIQARNTELHLGKSSWMDMMRSSISASVANGKTTN